jgi:predicted Zn-dependent protease
MRSSFARAVRLLMLAMLLSLSVARPAVAAGEAQLLRDSETELLFRDMAKPLIVAAGLDPDSVHIVLLNDPEINAFVTAGQAVYLHSGLIEASDNVNQIQGVVAHEIGHITGGHAIRLQDGAKEATGISIATLVLGALAVAAGAPDAGMALLMAGQRAAIGRFLAFTRTQEASADQAAVEYLHGAGISGKGFLQFFGKLQNQEYRLAIYEKDSYDRTHPLSNERIQALTERLGKDPNWNKPSDAALEARFQRVKAKLMGYLDPQRAVVKYPESNTTVPAHYARAYAYHLGGYPDKALAESEALLAIDPDDPFFLELKGQVLLESGKPKEALAPLREAVAKSGDSPLISAMLGHALVATEDKANFAEAKAVLKRAVNRDNNNPFAWFQLGIIYDREGDPARASLASAERYSLEGQPMMAMTKARIALSGIAAGSPDCLRAQDIALASKAELERELRDKSRDDIELRGAKEAVKIPDSQLVCRGS